MSRRKRFFSSLGSGYGTLLANLIYTGLSVPLALHYLGPALFGLWALVAQIGGYLALLDFGVNASMARILVDHKDDLNGGRYGSLLKSAELVFAAQGVIALAIGIIGSPVLANLAGIANASRPEFSLLMVAQCAVLAIGFLTKPFSLTLWSHQRADVVNYANIGSLLVSSVTLWLGFVAGLGIIAFPVSQFAGWVVNASVTVTMSRALGLLPQKECWGRVNSQTFGEIFSFSRDVFVLGLALQIISASQVIMVSRFLGLEAAATWSICTKVFQFAQQIVYRLFDFSEAAFSEMVVRREIERFKQRYASMVTLTASAAVLFAILGMAANAGLVRFWTSGRTSWNFTCDIAAGIFLVVSSVNRTYASHRDPVKRYQRLPFCQSPGSRSGDRRRQFFGAAIGICRHFHGLDFLEYSLQRSLWRLPDGKISAIAANTDHSRLACSADGLWTCFCGSQFDSFKVVLELPCLLDLCGRGCNNRRSGDCDFLSYRAAASA